MRTVKVLTAGVLTLAIQSALAIESDQLRGEVVDVDADDRTLQIEVTETGSNVIADLGATTSFHIPLDVPIEYQIETVRYSPYSDFSFSDIRSGDTVLLDFDETGQTIINFRNENTDDVLVRERFQNEGVALDDEELEAEAEQFAQNVEDEAEEFGNEVEEEFDNDEQYAMNDDMDRNELPGSASSLPLFALLGLMFAGLAAAVRGFRS